MGDYDFGSKGLWMFIIFMGILGILTGFGAVVYGIYWLITHVQFLP